MPDLSRFVLVRRDPDQATFEGWMASSNYPEIADVALAKLPDGSYRSQLTHAGWQGWQGKVNARPASCDALLTAMGEVIEAARGHNHGSLHYSECGICGMLDAYDTALLRLHSAQESLVPSPTLRA